MMYDSKYQHDISVRPYRGKICPRAPWPGLTQSGSSSHRSQIPMKPWPLGIVGHINYYITTLDGSPVIIHLIKVFVALFTNLTPRLSKANKLFHRFNQ